jgi:hypothetical protein
MPQMQTHREVAKEIDFRQWSVTIFVVKEVPTTFPVKGSAILQKNMTIVLYS